MKKINKTIFGALLAAFLVISISLIAPVQVQAAKINIKELKQDIGELAVDITGHGKYDELINNPDLKAIVEEIVESGATEQKALEYLDTIQNLDTFQELCTEDIKNNAESIKDSIDTILKGSSDSDSSNNNGFYITINEDNSLSISKKYSEKSVFIDSEGNIKIPGHETIDSDTWQNIKDFLILLFLVGAGAAVGVLIVAGVFFLLQAIVTAIATALGTIASVVVGVAIVLAAVALISAAITFIIDVIEFLTKSADSSSKTKGIYNKHRRMLSHRFMAFLNKVFSFFNLKTQQAFF